MPVSDEELIAYLLGDATPQQRKRVETGLADDENLRARLGELRLLLGHLDSLQHAYEPPVDLLASTMARIDAEAAEQSRESESRELHSISKVRLASSLSVAAETPVRRSTWDSMALVVCLAILYCLFLPTVLKARYESRKAQCAHNLRDTGRGLSELALLDPQRRFPAVAVDGPASFAGIYAVSLHDFGMLKSSSQLHCPSLDGVRPARAELHTIPTMMQLKTMDESSLRLCRESVGGDYAYNLGVVEEEQIVAPRYEGRSRFALLADMAFAGASGDEIVSHDGRGVNVLFEDGHIEFVSSECCIDSIGDNPYCNLLRERAVGLNKDDASLGPSYFRPLGND